jgi:hypothetical protein
MHPPQPPTAAGLPAVPTACALAVCPVTTRGPDPDMTGTAAGHARQQLTPARLAPASGCGSPVSASGPAAHAGDSRQGHLCHL